MRVCDIGPLLVELDGALVPCNGAKQEALLAMLAMNANSRVPLDDLIVAGWGYDAVVSSSTVENHIWRLRRHLGLGRSPSAGDPALITERNGYRLVANIEGLDSLRFEQQVAAVRTNITGRRLPDALSEAAAALALWRGGPYEAIGHVMGCAAAVARLEELRGQLVEQRLEALLAFGEVERALADLEVLVAQLPFRERLWALRMTGLARLGRVEEALGTYQLARTTLLDELGVEPGADLRELQRSILDGSETGLPHLVMKPPAPATIHLPRRGADLIGRSAELAQVTELVRRHPVVTVTGVGGCGKTRLALEAARELASDYPDGVWFLDLTEVTDSRLVLDMVVSQLSLTGAGGTATETLKDFVRQRRVLLLLDNCEHVLDGVAAVVEELLDEGDGWAVLATSREPIAVDSEVTWSLAPLSWQAEPAAGETLPAAVQLFLARMTAADATPSEDQLALVRRICAAVDGLPLAIELAAARTRTFSLPEIAGQVEEDPSRLARIGRGAADHRQTLASTLEWSHQLLSPTEQAVHRRLSVLPGEFTLPIATAVTGFGEVDVADVPALLARLVHRSLLVVAAPARAGRPSTFRQLDTVRAHARNRLTESTESSEAVARRNRWVSLLLAERPRLGRPEEANWYDTIEESYPAVRAALEDLLIGEPDLDALCDGAGLIWYWYYRAKVHEGATWLRQAVAVAGTGIEATLVRASLACALQLLVRPDEAEPHVTQLLADQPDRSSPRLAPLVEMMVGMAGGAWTLNDWALMGQICDQLVPLAAATGDPDLILIVEGFDCVPGFAGTEFDRIADRARRVYERAVELDNVCANWTACATLNIVALITADAELGLLWTERLLGAHRRLGTGGGGVYIEALANFLLMTGQVEQAVQCYAAARTHTMRSGMNYPSRTQSQELMDEARSRLPPAEYERLWQAGEGLTLDEIYFRRQADGATA